MNGRFHIEINETDISFYGAKILPFIFSRQGSAHLFSLSADLLNTVPAHAWIQRNLEENSVAIVIEHYTALFGVETVYRSTTNSRTKLNPNFQSGCLTRSGLIY